MGDFITKITTVNGQPNLTVNGEPRFLQAPFLRKTSYDSFAKAKTGIYMIYDPPIPVRPDGSVDLTEIEREADELLAREPEALIVMRSCPRPPLWWMDGHPDEMMKFDRDVAVYPGFEHYWDASWGSDVWLDFLKKCYHQACSQLHARYGGRIILYEFGMGACGENHPLGACARDGRWFCADFSKAMTLHFRRWLCVKYKSDAALQAGWSRTDMTLETALVPPREERMRTDWFTFRDPCRAWSADYNQCFAERITQIIITLAGEIKQATNRESLTGSHLGAMMDVGFHAYSYNQSCTNMVWRALNHPDVDTFTSPSSYENRTPGGDSTSMMPLGSYLLHNKLIFHDQDTRTYVVSEAAKRYRASPAYALGIIARDARETVGELKRDYGQAVIRGYGLWWHAMFKGMYDPAPIQKCTATLAEIGRRSLQFPRGVAPGAAIIVDEESAFQQQNANRLLYPMLYYQRQHQWGRSGIAWNLFLHNDLANLQFPDHRLYYFLNTFFLSDAEIESIEKRVKRNGATVIWTYAPGIQSAAGIDLKRASRLTGFNLRAAEFEALPRVTLTNLQHPFIRQTPITVSMTPEHPRHQTDSKNVPADNEAPFCADTPPHFIGAGPMGNDDRAGIFGPMIYVDDPDAEVLGELDPVQAPGFCVKKFADWTSVFVSVPMLNAFILRNIAREVGVHVYAEQNDVVLPGRSFLTVHARITGQKVIRLPAPADVYECYDQRLVGKNITEFRETLNRHDTGFYFLGDSDAWTQF